ncbi:MAG TPA: HU family DNA-binding protein [Rickettsiales bacterium]|nr:HU family DNA-binding protein [Rickettsiales bacterium]
MFKKELIDAITKKTGNTKVASEFFLDSLIEVILETLKKGEKVSLIGFGSWEIKKTKEKKGRNPRTGKPINIAAGHKVKFTAGKLLKKSVK